MEPFNEPEEKQDEYHLQTPPKARPLPEDLPRSLDDRRPYSSYADETEIYDAWQGRTPKLRTQACTKDDVTDK